jgi:hypothetical protein
MIDHPDLLDGPAFDRQLFVIPGRLSRLCKGGGAPQRNREQERLQNRLMRAQLASAEKGMEFPEIEIPPPPPPPPPPPGQTATDVEDAAQNARRRAGNRKGIQTTLLAGETGGYSGTTGGGSTLLGGQRPMPS